MMLNLINLESLLSLRLKGLARTPHEGMECRIIEVMTSEDSNDLVLWIAADGTAA